MRITESTIRRIIREEARSVMGESYQDDMLKRDADRARLASYKEQDVAAHKLIDALRGRDVDTGKTAEEIYPEAPELRKAIESNKDFFDEGMAVIRPSKSGDGLDVFITASSKDPINKTPMPKKILNLAGTWYEGGLDSSGARRRKIPGY